MDEQIETDALRDEHLARALLTIAEVTTAVEKIERYLETNGKYLSLDATVPMRHQTEVMRAALTKWAADNQPTPVAPPPDAGEVGAGAS